MSITVKQLRAAVWKEVYRYDGDTSFVTFASDDIPRMTVTHESRRNKPTRIYYTARGRKIDSPSQAVKLYNKEEVHGIQETQPLSRRPSPGSPKSIGRGEGSGIR